MANLAGSFDFLGFGIDIFGFQSQRSALAPLVNIDSSTPQDYMFPDPDIQGTYTIPNYATFGACGTRRVPQDYKKINLGSTRTEAQSTLAGSFGVRSGVPAFTGQFNASYSQTTNLTQEYFYCYYLENQALGSICTTQTTINQNISPAFRMAIDNLPATFDPTNPTPWFDFFDAYGGYYVSTLYYGGVFQYWNAVTTVNGLSRQNITSSFQVNADALANGSFTGSSTYTNYANNSSYEITTIGGSSSINIDPTLKAGAEAAQQAFQQIQAWAESTKMNPNVLIDIEVSPIWDLTTILTPTQSANMSIAFTAYTRRLNQVISIQTESTAQGRIGDEIYIANTKPAITVGGISVNALKPVVDPPRPPNPCFFNFDSGFQVVVIDALDPTNPSNVLWNKYYYIDLPSNELNPEQCGSSPDAFSDPWISSGQVSRIANQVYESAFQDLVTNNLVSDRNLLLFATFGMPKGFVPSGNFQSTLLGAGAANYSKPSANRTVETFQNWLVNEGRLGAGLRGFFDRVIVLPYNLVNYCLIGQFGRSPNQGAEVYVEDQVPQGGNLGYGVGVNLTATLFKTVAFDVFPQIGFDSANIV